MTALEHVDCCGVALQVTKLWRRCHNGHRSPLESGKGGCWTFLELFLDGCAEITNSRIQNGDSLTLHLSVFSLPFSVMDPW